LNAKKFAILRTRLFINTGFIGFSNIIRPVDLVGRGFSVSVAKVETV
jgi:hypothetical protein